MPDANRVTLYTTEPCGFCRQAKALLAGRGVAYEEVNLSKDPDGRAALVMRTGQMTFPQIVVGERAIGGFRELLQADRGGARQTPLAARDRGLPERREYLARGSLSCLVRPVEVALEVDRRVLAGEMARTHLFALGAGELRVLADLPVRVRAPRQRVRRPVVDGRAAVPARADPRKHGLDLAEELLCARGRRTGSEAVADRATRVVHEDPRGARLRARDLPRVLVAGVRARLAVRAERVPVAG